MGFRIFGRLWMIRDDSLAKINLKLLKLCDFKVSPTLENQAYVFVKANSETIGDSQEAHSTFNYPNGGFANLIRKITIINDETN